MSNIVTKRSRFYRLILAALCLCLSINSLACALSMAPHNMAPADSTHHAAHLDESQINTHSAHHNPNLPEQDHNCCNDDRDPCSTSSACATHCIASIAQKSPQLCPAIAKNSFTTDVSSTSPLFLNLDGPFKPPR